MAQFVWPGGAGSVSVNSISIEVDGLATQVSVDTDTPANSVPLPVFQSGSAVVDTIRNDYASTNVGDSTWVQLDAGIAGACNGITLFDSGGYCMELGIGAAASETRLLLIPPGGFNGVIPVAIAQGTRLSIRGVETGVTVSVGQLVMNLLR